MGAAVSGAGDMTPYGDQTPSEAWKAKPSTATVAIRQLRGEPSPEALACLFATVSGKGRKQLERKVFGLQRRRGD